MSEDMLLQQDNERIAEYLIEHHGCDRKTTTFGLDTVQEILSPLLRTVDKLPRDADGEWLVLGATYLWRMGICYIKVRVDGIQLGGTTTVIIVDDGTESDGEDRSMNVDANELRYRDKRLERPVED